MFGGGGGMTEMIRRFDRNQNNMIDPEEAQGPAGFFLQRMAQNNPKIDLSKPIPLDTITSEMDKMRGGRGGGDSQGQNGSGPGGSGTSNSPSTPAKPKLLVPDFSLSQEPVAIPGFGSSSNAPTVQITDRDRAESEERIRRYDKNNDKILDSEEIAQGRWSDDVMQYDRNKDGKLSIEELAVRQANRRVAEQQPQQSSNGSNNSSSGWGGGSGGPGGSGSSGWSRGGSDRGAGADGWSRGGTDGAKKKDEPKRFGDAKSYKMAPSSATTSGLPSFFTTSDINADNQVTLSEFAGTLTETALAEFQQWDSNGDGIITARECQAAVKAGVQVGGGSSSSKPSSVASGSSPPKNLAVSASDLEHASKVIGKYDKDKDGFLSKAEVEKMLVKPSAKADVNNDGKIGPEEYAASLKS
jgi:Ca2+-binding EF-hand superfamily protein